MSKILTIDDSASLRQMVVLSLRSAGHEVSEAFDGVDGLEKATADQFDAFIVDVNMPRMNGIELTRKLRALQKYAHTPILILTTESTDERKRQGRDAGATGWMVKPFNPTQLVDTVRRVVP
ncbi:MAG: response regulator [Gammaproteobacteria bacterium]